MRHDLLVAALRAMGSDLLLVARAVAIATAVCMPGLMVYAFGWAWTLLLFGAAAVGFWFFIRYAEARRIDDLRNRTGGLSG